jgi:hypothetical protein
MSDEDRLRDRLRAQAHDVPIVSDLDDVAVRLGRRTHNRKRPLAAAAVAVVVVAAAIGVVAERAGHDTGRVRVAGSGGPDLASTTEGHALVLVPGTIAPGGVTGPTGAPSIGGEATVPATTLVPGAVPPQVAPLTLPAPGPQQPADPEAARQAITHSFEALGGAPPNSARVEAIEDGASLVPAMDQLRSGPYAKMVLEAKTVMMGIVFLSPTQATVEFRSDLGADGISGPYMGDAILTPAGWQISHAFYCKLIAQAGVNCP